MYIQKASYVSGTQREIDIGRLFFPITLSPKDLPDSFSADIKFPADFPESQTGLSHFYDLLAY
jgi:hypothetical protein